MPGARMTASPLDLQLSARHDTFVAQRPPGADEDVHMLPAIVDHVIERCTVSGGVVFDPFAGFGTTLERAVQLGRAAWGIELLPERVEYIQRRTPQAHVIEGDARELLRLTRAARPGQATAFADLVLTSPPYMSAAQGEPDALTAYENDDGDYPRYLVELGYVAAQCARVVVPGGYVVWNASDIGHGPERTPLIDDLTRVLQQHLDFVAVTPIEWDAYPHDLSADALLVFQRPPHGRARERAE